MGRAVNRTLEHVIRRLEERTEAARRHPGDDLARFAKRHDLTGWEGRFSPYDDRVYQAVLNYLGSQDVVLDLGAGDLRLALQMAERVQKVYAVEVNPLLVAQALETVGFELPRNLQVICANALDLDIPSDTTVAVLLMRHCHHFQTYVDRLKTAGCSRLVTNARWRTAVEMIDLTVAGRAYEDVHEGWYACRCGATGYVGAGRSPGAPPIEVAGCPSCTKDGSSDQHHSQEEPHQ